MYKCAGLFVGIITVPALISVTSIAQGTLPSFDELDRNNDGLVLQREAEGTELETIFQEIDTDRDRSITEQEYEQYKREQNGSSS